jgi:biotin carboxyl carrier protein
MKIQVRVDDQVYEVEVDNVHTRPIVVTIEGEQFEVWPEDMPAAEAPVPARVIPINGRGASAAPAAAPPPPAAPVLAPAGAAGAGVVRAPLPGVVASIAVQPGVAVTVGQELCVLEAMKMQNAIRATRAGTIAAVRITLGQHVRHSDVLFEYAE